MEVPDLRRGLFAAKPMVFGDRHHSCISPLATDIIRAGIIPEVAMKFVTFKAMADDCAVIVVKLMGISWLN